MSGCAVGKAESILCGATAVRSICGEPLAIGKIGGHAISLPDNRLMLATVRSSYILRIRDNEDRHAQFRAFVADLKVGARFLKNAA